MIDDSSVSCASIMICSLILYQLVAIISAYDTLVLLPKGSKAAPVWQWHSGTMAFEVPNRFVTSGSNQLHGFLKDWWHHESYHRVHTLG